jgi:hypothetical protein
MAAVDVDVDAVPPSPTGHRLVAQATAAGGTMTACPA